jgi:hypothetical protein
MLGLRIFEATNAGIADLGEEHGHQGVAGVRQEREGGHGPPAASRRASG